jgi:hypothetical protein
MRHPPPVPRERGTPPPAPDPHPPAAQAEPSEAHGRLGVRGGGHLAANCGRGGAESLVRPPLPYAHASRKGSQPPGQLPARPNHLPTAANEPLNRSTAVLQALSGSELVREVLLTAQGASGRLRRSRAINCQIRTRRDRLCGQRSASPSRFGHVRVTRLTSHAAGSSSHVAPIRGVAGLNPNHGAQDRPRVVPCRYRHRRRVGAAAELGRVRPGLAGGAAGRGGGLQGRAGARRWCCAAWMTLRGAFWGRRWRLLVFLAASHATKRVDQDSVGTQDRTC